MAGITREYLRSIIPDDMPDGIQLLKEGEAIGGTFETKPSKYALAKGYDTVNDYFEATRGKGKPKFMINVGMPTLQETVDGCLDLCRWARKELGVEVFCAGLPSVNVGVPKELRDPAMNTNAFMMETQEDYDALNQEDGVILLSNHALTVPNAIETTVNCLKAGIGAGIGTTSQLAWDYPGCTNYKEDISNLVRALGIMKAHPEARAMTTCYTEDGLASSCVDTISFIAYYLFEHYIYKELCGVDINCAFGALCSDIKTKAALMVAIGSLEKDLGHPTLTMVHGSCTTQWDHDIEANYGSSLQEQLLLILTEMKYNFGCGILSVPITEALRVPTMQELKNIISASARMTEFADEWIDIINWEEIESRAEILKREGIKMYHNMLETLDELGLDIKNPAELLMFIKRVDSALFEESFHPSIRETGKFKPWFPNDMGAMTMEMVDESVKELKGKGFDGSTLKGKTIILGSTDTHSYGARFVQSVLNEFGCKVINTGADNSTQALFDTADEEGVTNIAISTHSGQALGISDQVIKIIEERGDKYNVFMGGVLNAILPGHAEATDVSDMIEDKGIIAENNMERMIKTLAES